MGNKSPRGAFCQFFQFYKMWEKKELCLHLGDESRNFHKKGSSPIDFKTEAEFKNHLEQNVMV